MTGLLDSMGALVLEDGGRWGAKASPAQWKAAEAVTSSCANPADPRSRFWIQRARGGSKTTDAAGFALVLMNDLYPAFARLYVLAADQGQGQLFLDAMRGMAARTRHLQRQFNFTETRATARRTGCRLDVLAADVHGSYGLRPALIFIDELTEWPNSRRYRELHESMITAVDKTGGRLVITTTAGDPEHWTYQVLKHARSSEFWYVQEEPGPPGWMPSHLVEEQRRTLLDSHFQRRILNKWQPRDDRLTTREEVHACIGDYKSLAPVTGMSYVIGLDVGLVNDRTAAVIAHGKTTQAQDGSSKLVVVVDQIVSWHGSKAEPVDLEYVEKWVTEQAREYRAKVIVDPYQTAHLQQSLRTRSIQAEAFTFTPGSISRLATSLLGLIRRGLLTLPNDEDLIDELLNVRLVETSSGVYRLDHEAARHDDQVIALAVAANAILEKPPPPGPRLRALIA